MGDNNKKSALKIVISKQRDSWKIKKCPAKLYTSEKRSVKNTLPVSIPVVVYHNYRKTQSTDLKKLLLTKRKKLVAKRQRLSLTNAKRNTHFISQRRRPTNKKAVNSQTQAAPAPQPEQSIKLNSIVQNPNIAIGIVSLLQPDTIASILRQNNVEIPMSASNTDKDINNNNTSNASTGESLNTRNADNMDKSVNVDTMTESNKNKEETEVKAVKETQTDYVIAASSDDRQNLVPIPVPEEPIPLVVPPAPINFPSQETIDSLCRLRDWNTFYMQTEMSRTHHDWFDPNHGKKTTPVRRTSQRKQSRNEVLNLDPCQCSGHRNPSRMVDCSGPEVPMSSAHVPTNLVGFEEYQLAPRIQYAPAPVPNIQPVMHPPRIYDPNILRNPVPLPCQARGARPCTSDHDELYHEHQHQLHQYHRRQPSSSSWSSSRNQFQLAHAHQRRTSPRIDPMARQTYIDDPRRRTYK